MALRATKRHVVKEKDEAAAAGADDVHDEDDDFDKPGALTLMEEVCEHTKPALLYLVVDGSILI